MADRALAQGVLLGYHTVEEALPAIRGRVRESEQIRRRFGAPLPVEVVYDDYSPDIAENRILLAAARRLLRLGGMPGTTRALLHRVVSRLDGVTAPVPGHPLPRWRPTRLNTRYQAPLGLAELVLRSGSYQWTFTQVAAAAAEILERTGERRYEHVVVDEAQDLHPAKWRLIRALVAEGPDDLFIAGDPHQRIYDHRVSLASLGISVRGRSRRLTVSYRSTQEILSWAVRLLGDSPATGLDDLEDRLDTYSSPLHGRRPTVRGLSDRAAELDAVVEQVREWIDQGVEAGSIGISGRTRKVAEAAADSLKAAGIDCGALAKGPGVRVGTMHAMKGLEFRCVAVVGVDDGLVPNKAQIADGAADPAGHARDLQRERNLLFVSCTRARDALYVSHSGNPSPFLPVK